MKIDALQVLRNQLPRRWRAWTYANRLGYRIVAIWWGKNVYYISLWKEKP